MIAVGLYMLAVIAVWGGLLRHLQGVYAVAMLAQVLLAVGLHYGYDRLGPRRAVGLTGATLAGILVLVASSEGVAWGPVLTALAVLGILLTFAGSTLAGVQTVVTTALPAIGVLLIVLVPATGRGQLFPVFLLLWSLAAWPVLATLGSGRRWAAAGLGVLAVVLVIHGTLARSDVDTATVMAVTRFDWYGYEALLALVQTALVGFGIAPKLLNSQERWRWAAFSGLALTLIPIALAVATGPWPAGWPTIVSWIAVPAGIISLLGLIGMLCTIREPEHLADHAVRTIALGLGATASLLVPLVASPMPTGTLIPALTTACAPLLWSLVLSLALSITGLVAQQRGQPIGTTTRYRMRLRPQLRQSFLDAGRTALADLRAESGELITPRAILPLLILLATWPAWRFLGSAAILPVFALLMVPCAPLVRTAPLPWALLLGTLIGTSCWLLGLPVADCLGLAALGVACAWPFVRWRQLNPAWAYAAGMWLVGILWQEIGGPPDGLLAVALGLGVVVLTTNALAPAGARAPMLVATAVWLLLFLSSWVPTQDPYFPLLLQGENRWREVGKLLLQLPVLTLTLTVLWLSRHRMQRPGWRMPRWQRGLFGICAIGAIGWWASGLRVNLAVGLLCWVVLLLAVVPVTNEVGDGERIRVWEPIIDAISFVVAILVIAVGHSAELAVAGETVEPGRLGVVLIEALRDLVALAVSVGALLLASSAGRRLQAVPDALAYVQTLAVRVSTGRVRIRR